MGGSRARVSRPGKLAPGRPFGLPRTAAMTRHGRHKKSACCRTGRLCANLIFELLNPATGLTVTRGRLASQSDRCNTVAVGEIRQRWRIPYRAAPHGMESPEGCSGQARTEAPSRIKTVGATDFSRYSNRAISHDLNSPQACSTQHLDSPERYWRMASLPKPE